MKNLKNFRQGDVILMVTKSIPKSAKKLNHWILAEGEITGHKHQIAVEDRTNCELYELDGQMFLKVNEISTLKHDEHKAIELEKGIYEIKFPREYDYVSEEIRRVTD